MHKFGKTAFHARLAHFLQHRKVFRAVWCQLVLLESRKMLQSRSPQWQWFVRHYVYGRERRGSEASPPTYTHLYDTGIYRVGINRNPAPALWMRLVTKWFSSYPQSLINLHLLHWEVSAEAIDCLPKYWALRRTKCKTMFRDAALKPGIASMLLSIHSFEQEDTRSWRLWQIKCSIFCFLR